MPQPTILLTGATGHLGAAVIKQLLGSGSARLRLLIRDEHKLRELAAADTELEPVLDCERIVADIRDRAAVEQALDGIESVIHACHSHEYWNGPQYLLDVNVGGARNLVQAIQRSPTVRNVVFVGSYSAHGASLHGGPCPAPAPSSARECSSRSKRLAQQVFLEAASAGGFRLDVVSPSYLIGPLQLDPTYFGALFHRVLLGPLRWCPPNGINVVDVRDVAHAVVCCAGSSRRQGQRILASGDNVSLLDLFDGMNREAGFATTPRRVPSELFTLVPPLKQFGSFGRQYFRTNHYVENAGLESRRYCLADSIRDTLSWARRAPLYRHRGDFLWWLAERYLF